MRLIEIFIVAFIGMLAHVHGFQHMKGIVSRRTTTTNLQMVHLPDAHTIFNSLPVMPAPSTFMLSALDADTLEALGDVQDINNALGDVLNESNPALSILTKAVSSPAILAVPIGAGSLVAFAIGFFIYSYGQGRDD